MPDNHQKVCIIGAGPGGMSAAYYLALKGYTREGDRSIAHGGWYDHGGNTALQTPQRGD